MHYAATNGVAILSVATICFASHCPHGTAVRCTVLSPHRAQACAQPPTLLRCKSLHRHTIAPGFGRNVALHHTLSHHTLHHHGTPHYTLHHCTQRRVLRIMQTLNRGQTVKRMTTITLCGRPRTTPGQPQHVSTPWAVQQHTRALCATTRRPTTKHALQT